MDRYAAIAALLLAATGSAKSPPKKAAPGISVRSIDLHRRYVLIELTGVKKPPAPNLYRLTDVRGRHFVALNSSCDPPFPSGARMCELQIPDGYERHRLQKLELHLGSLKSRMIAASEADVAAAWSAAEAALKEPAKRMAPSPSPRPSPSPSPRPKK
jgi:hypothetical protein